MANILVDSVDPQSMRLRDRLRERGYTIEYPRRPLPETFSTAGVAGVFGRIDFTLMAFDKLGIPRPAPLGFPPGLPLDRRHIELMTWSDALREIDAQPLFVKPAEHLKLFTGCVMEHPIHLLKEPLWSEPVWVSSPVNFTHEWRILVCDGVRLASPSYGDVTKDLTADQLVEIDGMVAALGAEDMPAAYSLDVGLIDGIHLAVVELNDCWSLGGYQEDDALIRCVLRRFEELLDSRPAT